MREKKHKHHPPEIIRTICAILVVMIQLTYILHVYGVL